MPPTRSITVMPTPNANTIRRGLAALAAALLVGAAAPADPSLAAAEAMVRKLYVAPDASREAVQQLYAPELATALLKAMEPNSPSGLPFDMRYGDDEWIVADLAFSTVAVGDGATVTASFKNDGMAHRIDWRLVRTPSGWRIADVTAPEEGDSPAWSLLDLLRQPGPPRL